MTATTLTYANRRYELTDRDAVTLRALLASVVRRSGSSESFTFQPVGELLPSDITVLVSAGVPITIESRFR